MWWEQRPEQPNVGQVKKIIDVIKESQATTKIARSIRYIRREKQATAQCVQYATLGEEKRGCACTHRHFWKAGGLPEE